MCRRAGAFIAGFLEQGMIANELQRVAYGDPRWDVCAEAQKAIRSHQREAEAVKLAAKMDSVRSSDVWSTIDGIVQLADPGILVLETDPVGILRRLRSLPFVVRRYASEAIRRRKKKLEDEMTSLHSKWRDED
jgi:hypothetical protein